MKTRAILVLAMLVLLFGSASTNSANTASFQGLGDLPGANYWSAAYGVAPDGSVVVGFGRSGTGWDDPFRWTTDGGLENLGGWADQFAYDVSGDGSVVVGNGEDGFGFRWTAEGGMVRLPRLPGGSFSGAYAISADGSVIVGYSNRVFDVFDTEAVQWRNGMVSSLGDLPGGDFWSTAAAVSADGSVIAGRSESASGIEPFRWEDGVMTGLGDLPGGSHHASAKGISADGSVVVGFSYYNGTSNFEAFRWESGVMTGLGGWRSVAYDVTADGLVIVGRNGGWAFVWEAESGMRNLQDVLAVEYSLDLSGWILGEARAISDDGLTIVGRGTNPEGNMEAWIVKLPEPPKTYYVDAVDGNDNNDGLSPQTPFATIQKAINSAYNGDTVIVADGTYTGPGNRDIDFLGKAITVRSESGPENCIIDCNATETDRHRGFKFHLGESPNSVVAGFTITNGYALGDKGGGIFCDYSNPTITGCKIEGNYAKYKGGGMYNNYSNPSVNDCTFSGNSVYGEGGGIFNYHSNPTVTNCTFIDGSAMHGGGMHNWASSPIVTNCLFSGNSTSHSAAGMFNREGGSPTVRNCKFIGNSAGSTGGGMFNFDGSNSLVVNCLFRGNSANGEGGGMYNCSHYNGPAIYPTVVNCTFSGNFALMDGGGIYDRRQANPILVNCILWGNSDSSGMDESAQIHKSDGGTPVVNYCCVQGWTGILGGMGNIGADPYFVYPTTGNYHLLPGSPCINAGDPNYIAEPNETDLNGNPRVIGGRIDMGAYEFNHLPVACIVGGDRTVEAGSGCEARVTLDGSCSSDADSTPGTNDDINDFDWYEMIDVCDPNSDIYLGSGEIIDCNLSLGEHDIILEVIDKAGAFDANEVTIIVEDTTPPEFSLSVAPDVLWPPNHKMIEIGPSWVVSDNCDESPDVSLVSITIEGDDVQANDDVQVDPNDGSIYLRAKRSGASGRVYIITYQAADDSGNVTVNSTTVTVPHDRRRR